MRRILVSAVCVALAACGSSDSGTIETEDGEVTYDVDQSGSDTTATFSGANGEEVTFETGPGADVDLPDGFSLYPGASVLSSTNVNTGQGSGSMIMIQSGDTPEKVAAFYRSQAEKAGVEIKMEMKAGDSQIISGESPDGIVFNVNASPADEGGTTAQVTIGNKL